MICLAEGCNKPARARGMCVPHYHRWKRWYRMGRIKLPPYNIYTTDCHAPDCPNPQADRDGRGYCAKHAGQRPKGPEPDPETLARLEKLYDKSRKYHRLAGKERAEAQAARKELAALLHECLQQGIRPSTLAKKLGMLRHAIHRYLTDNGYPLHPKNVDTDNT